MELKHTMDLKHTKFKNMTREEGKEGNPNEHLVSYCIHDKRCIAYYKWEYYPDLNLTTRLLVHGDSENRWGFMVHSSPGDTSQESASETSPDHNVRRWTGEFSNHELPTNNLVDAQEAGIRWIRGYIHSLRIT